MPPDVTQQDIIRLITRLAGQANVLTIPRLFIALADGNLEAALLLSQCLYWGERTRDPAGWFYKTAEEWDTELGLSEYQVRKARKVLAPLGLETDLRAVGNVPKMHYRINGDQLSKCILQKLRNAPVSLSSEHIEESTESTNTEITAETTAETGVNKVNKNGSAPLPHDVAAALYLAADRYHLPSDKVPWLRCAALVEQRGATAIRQALNMATGATWAAYWAAVEAGK